MLVKSLMFFEFLFSIFKLFLFNIMLVNKSFISFGNFKCLKMGGRIRVINNKIVKLIKGLFGIGVNRLFIKWVEIV